MLDSTQPIANPPNNGSVFLRLVWFGALPSMVICLFLVALDGHAPWTLGPRDLALLLIVTAGVAARAADVHWFDGTTAQGDPATSGDVLAYAAFVLAIAVPGWLGAQLIAL